MYIYTYILTHTYTSITACKQCLPHLERLCSDKIAAELLGAVPYNLVEALLRHGIQQAFHSPSRKIQRNCSAQAQVSACMHACIQTRA